MTWNAASANFRLCWLRHILTRPTKRRGKRSSASSAISASALTMGMGEAAGRNREEPCLLLLVSTAATVPGSVNAGWGASHFAELWYVFDHPDQSPWNWTVADRKLADTMSSHWVNLARSGDPNH